MLQIRVPIAPEMWDEAKSEFIPPKEVVLSLEHSLVSLSKWESKWCKPFLSSDKTPEELLDYIRCMTVTQNVNPNIYNCITEENVKQVDAYIRAPMTATTFSAENGSKKNREIITAEVIYYWMIAQQIPVEFQKWHLNKLLTLIRVCNVKNTPPKKRSKREIMAQNAALNAARRKQFNSKG